MFVCIYGRAQNPMWGKSINLANIKMEKDLNCEQNVAKERVQKEGNWGNIRKCKVRERI